MYRIIKFISFFLLFTTSYFLLATGVSAKDYSINTADFKIQLQEDGSADVTETRTYQFDGSYSWADEWINLIPKCTNCSNYRISNFELWEGTQKYIESNNSSEGNFYSTNDGKKFYIKWYYRANYESKTFTLKYRIENAITVQQDISEFYWQLIGDKWVEPTGRVTADVYLPGPVEDDQIWAFGHGPLNGIVSIPTNQKVTFSADNLSANNFFEVRVLFPKLDNANSTQKGNLTLESILQEEKSFGEKTEREKGLSKVVLIVSLLVPLILWIVFLAGVVKYLILRHKEGPGKPLPSVNLADKLHEPPSDLPPAMVESLVKLNKNFSSNVFLSTILSLVQKRTIKIKSVKGTNFWGLSKYEYSLLKGEKFTQHHQDGAGFNGKDNLLDFEREVLDFLFDDIALGREEISFKEIKKYSQSHSTSSYDFFQKFKKKAFENLLGTYVEKVPADIKKKGRSLLKKGFIGQFLYFIILIFGFIILKRFSGIGAVFVSSMAILSFQFFFFLVLFVVILSVFPFDKRRTERGLKETAEWLAFKKWLKEYSVTKNYPVDSIILWEKYLVYGTLFGVSLKALSSLPVSFSEEEFVGIMAVNYGVYHSGDFGNFSSSLTSSFQSLGSSFSNSFSGGYGAHGVGSSGGFSGGGGGGGGGGGAG